jgi:hypothetical protein
MKNYILLIFLLWIIAGCEKSEIDNGMTSIGPVDVYLVGKWKLEKIENTKASKITTQFGYTEILEVGNNNIDDFNKIYRNGILVNSYFRERSRGVQMSSKNMTVLDKFRDDKVRFYRIVNANTGNISIEASAYLKEVGTASDTLKYYYIPTK